MLEQKNYNFEIIFEKIEEAKKSGECCEGIDLQFLQEIDCNIKVLEEYTNLLKETEYHSYTRT